MVFTLSKNTLARFSSPFVALTLKIFVDSPVSEPAIIPGGGIPVALVEVVVVELPINVS